MSDQKQLYDGNKVIIGLAVFCFIALFPFWHLLWGQFLLKKNVAPPVPQLTEQAKEAKQCVRDTNFMKKEHMQLLYNWRENVVRDKRRTYKINGKSYNMSLTNTCMGCHSNKAEFCDRCHNYASVAPYCWDCHIDNPKEGEE